MKLDYEDLNCLFLKNFRGVWGEDNFSEKD